MCQNCYQAIPGLESAKITTGAYVTTRGGQTTQVRFKSPETNTYVIISYNEPCWFYINGEVTEYDRKYLHNVIEEITPYLDEFDEQEKVSIVSAILALGI